MSTCSHTWKNFEREVARFFGGERTPLSGMCESLTKADIMHEFIFAECKLRDNFAIFTRYRAEQAETLKTFKNTLKSAPNTRFRPPIFLLKNYKKYQGDLWLIDYEYFPLIADSAIIGKRDDGTPSITYLSSRIQLFDKYKADTILNVFKDAEEKAIKERKIPVVAIKMKGKKGWMCVVKPSDIPEIKNHIYEIAVEND